MTKSRQDQAYFRPRNWGRFQTRSKAQCHWSKLHHSILDDSDLDNLTESQQLVAYKLIPLFGRIGKPLPWDCGYIRRALKSDNRRIGSALEALKSIGFIELCESTSDLWGSAEKSKSRVDKIKKGLPNGSPKESPATPALALEPEPPPVAKPKSRNGTKLPEDWQPNPDDVTYAKERGFDEADIQDQLANFVDHFTNGNGRNKTRANWSLSWKRWIREQPTYRKAGTGGNAPNGNRQGNGGIVAASRRVASHFSDPSRPRPRPHWRDD